jgi:hypothetical protein
MLQDIGRLSLPLHFLRACWASHWPISYQKVTSALTIQACRDGWCDGKPCLGEVAHQALLGVWIATLIHCCQEIRPWISATPLKSNSERNRLPRVAVVLEVQSKQGPK